MIVIAKERGKRRFSLGRAILDGTDGLILSLPNRYYTFLKYAKVWENKNMKG